MLGYLDRAGYVFVPKPEEADVIILNTCGFIQPAREESAQALMEASKLKAKHQQKTIIAAGCYVERSREALQRMFPEIDTWIGVNEFSHIVEAVEGKPYKKPGSCFLYDHTTPRIISTPPSWTYIKISEGCSHECSFCAIPQIKGPYRSRAPSSILREAEILASQGVKEINLISQDSTYYGRDRGLKDGLSALLKELIHLRGIEWIRLLYGYKEDITD